MDARRLFAGRGPVAPLAWWERLLRLPAGLAITGSIFAALPNTSGPPVHVILPMLLAASTFWVALLLSPTDRPLTRLCWSLLALATGALYVVFGGASLAPGIIVLPLLATLPLTPLEGVFLLLISGEVMLRIGMNLQGALAWFVASWAVLVATALLRQVMRERGRADAILGDCLHSVSSNDDHAALQSLRLLTTAEDVALLRGDPRPLGISAVERPFIWLHGDRLREDTALVAQGLVQLPAAFPRESAMALELPFAPGSKLFVAGAAPGTETLYRTLAQLFGLRESKRWLSDRLRLSDYSALESLVLALDARDPYTRGHSERVASYAVAIGRELGFGTELLDELKRGGMLHDIGKIGIPEQILQKPAQLSPEEYAVMQTHVKIGVEIIDAINSSVNVLDIVCGHHEHHNGTGYPRRLRGDQIPLLARIAHVADSFEAMTSARSYNQPKSVREGIAELRRCAGSQFHPEIVEAFAALANHGALAGPST